MRARAFQLAGVALLAQATSGCLPVCVSDIDCPAIAPRCQGFVCALPPLTTDGGPSSSSAAPPVRSSSSAAPTSSSSRGGSSGGEVSSSSVGSSSSSLGSSSSSETSSSSQAADAGPPDGGPPDAGAGDAGAMDAGPTDAHVVPRLSGSTVQGGGRWGNADHVLWGTVPVAPFVGESRNGDHVLRPLPPWSVRR